jgi:hypothetical protein
VACGQPTGFQRHAQDSTQNEDYLCSLVPTLPGGTAECALCPTGKTCCIPELLPATRAKTAIISLKGSGSSVHLEDQANG